MIWLVTLTGVAIAVAVAVSLLGRGRAASPRLLAGLYLVGLAGLVLLPSAALSCTLVGLVPATGVPSAGCVGAATRSWWPVAAAATGLLTLGPLVWHAAHILIATTRTTPSSAVLAGAERRRTCRRAVVWVLPSSQLAAHTCGTRHPRAIVTRGLLDLLGPAEQQAVCEHEAAHLRLGHPRLLLVAAPIARTYRFLPGVGWAFARLRRELEAAADDEAAAAVGAAPVLSALARVALARTTTTGGAAAGFAEAEHLRYRITRLQHPRPTDRRAGALTALGGLALIAGFILAACALATGTTTALGVAACTIPLATLALRPVWPRTGPTPASARGSGTDR